MTQLQAKVRAIMKSYPIPTKDKLERRLYNIERMITFYEEKVPVAPEKQSRMFKSYVVALKYISTTAHQYRRLTIKIAELAGEEDENRTNS